MDGVKVALKAVKIFPPGSSGAIINYLKPSQKVIGFWNNRDREIRPELWLDLYTAMKKVNLRSYRN